MPNHVKRLLSELQPNVEVKQYLKPTPARPMPEGARQAADKAPHGKQRMRISSNAPSRSRAGAAHAPEAVGIAG